MQRSTLRVARLVRTTPLSPPIQQSIRRFANTHGSNEWRRAKRQQTLIQQYNHQTQQHPTHITLPTPTPSSSSNHPASPSPFASSPSAASLPSELVIPHTCLGCGAALQSEYEHEAGYVEQNSVDQYVDQLSKALQPHAHKSADKSESSVDEEAADVEADAEHRESSDELVAAEAAESVAEHEKLAAEEKSQDEVDDDAAVTQPSTDFTNDVEWQSAYRRGEISNADLLAHNITVITPKQLKQQLKQLRHSPRHSSLPTASEPSAAWLPKPLRCVRCFQLTHYGHTRGNIATAISSDFRQLLQSRFLPSASDPSPPSAVILLLVDILDFHCSLPPYLPSLLGGRNPIILVANKRDLLPQSYGPNRLLAWLKAEGRRYGIHYHSVQLVSAKSGEGVPGLMRKAGELAAREGVVGRRDIYLIGAVNTGKSSLMNKLQEMRYVKKGELASSSAVTSSIYPGTTLGLVAFPLIPARDGTIYDTPGVLSHPLSSVLTHDELKAILPTRPILPVTYRLSEGQTILLGGMARIDHISGRPFLYTVYVSGGITIHVTNAAKLDTDDGAGMREFYQKHAGTLVTPPFSYERYVELGLGRGGGMTFDLKGRGWDEACDDIVLPGLGWVAVTGAGDVQVRVMVAGIEVTEKEKQLTANQADAEDASRAREAREERVLPFAREPLMPLDARASMRKFHGSDTRQNRRTGGAPTKRMQQQRGFHTLSAFARTQPSYTISDVFSACVRHFSSSSPAGVTPAVADIATSSASGSHASTPSTPPPTIAPSQPPPQPFSSSSSSPMARRSLSSYGRPQWNVYKQLLITHSTSIQAAYRTTEQYVKAPKGSWRMQGDGRLVKLFRWRDKWEKGGKHRKRMEQRLDKRRQRQETQAADADE